MYTHTHTTHTHTHTHTLSHTHTHIYIHMCIRECPPFSKQFSGNLYFERPRLNNATKGYVTPRILTSFVKNRLGRKTLTRKYFSFYN